MNDKPSLEAAEQQRLDPDRFPRRLDLDLNEEVYGRLLAISQESGRTVQEIAAEILGSCIASLAAEEDP
jgi:hypothetical protein